MAAPIGTLAGSLTLESAAFIRDLGKAANAVNSSTARMSRSFAAVEGMAKRAFAGYVGVQGVRALANLAKSAIDTGDEIEAAATKLGIGSVALQKFRFAAAQTDVDVGSLDAALKVFSKNLATGGIKSSTGDIADAFSEWITKIQEAPSQLEKVNLAVKAFGKQYQSAILIAEQGGVFTQALKDAFVISAKGTKIASDLDNRLRSISNAVSTGFDTGFLEAFVGKLDNSDTKLKELNTTFNTLGGIVGTLAVKVTGMLGVIGKFLSDHPDFMRQAFALDMGMDLSGVPGGGVPGMKGAGRGAKPAGAPLPALDFEAIKALGTESEASVKKTSDAFVLSSDAIKKAQGELFKEGMTLFEQTRTPMEQYASSVEQLSVLQKAGAIDAETFARAHQQLTLGMASNWTGAAAAVSGALASIFKDNKAVAIANVVINTADAIVSALKNPPGPPFSYAYAAAAAATGAAQIATILSTQPGSGPKSTALKAGKTSAATSATSGGGGGAGAGGPRQTITLSIIGDVFGPEHFRKIIDGINGAQRDGTPLLLMG